MNNRFKNIEALKRTVFENSNRLHSYFNVQEAIDDVHVRYHHALTQLFGKSNDTSTKGVLKTDLKFDKNDFILFSFKSYKGQIPANVDGTDKKFTRRRFNLYRKGRIWSSSALNYGRNFYSFLEKLDDAFHETPVNLISYAVWQFKQGRKSAFRLTVTQDKTKKGKEFLYFPSSKALRAIKDTKLTEFLHILESTVTDKKFLSDPFPSARVEADMKELSSRMLLLPFTDPIFDKVITSFQNVFDIGDAQLDRPIGTGETLGYRIKVAALIYCYNHLPFDLHLFYPPTDKVGKDDLYTLMVALDPAKSLTAADVKLFTRIVEESPNLPEYEDQLMQKARQNDKSLLRWKYIYEQNQDKYSTFISAVENVCRSLCQQNNIKKSVVSSRLKTFESFYNKLIQRANDENEQDRTKYLDAIENPDKYKDFVFNSIRDIAGVRIICVFNDEVGKLEELFKGGLDKSDFECSDIKKYSQNRIADSHPAWPEHKNEYNYRGFHVTVKPGEARRKLVEYMHIDSVQCEIQIRTYFAHGWSDVEHPIIYKDKLHLEVIDRPFRDRIKKKLGSISKTLKTYDEDIAGIKRNRDNYKFPITE